VIPTLILIWFGGLILKHMKFQDRLKSYYKYSFVFLFALVVFVVLFEKSMRTHNVKFKFDESISISITAVERPSFLDSPTDYTFLLQNSKTDQNLSFDFFKDDGAYFKFHSVKGMENLLIIDKAGGSPPVYWVINLNTLKIKTRKTEFLHETNFNLVEKVRLNYNYELVYNKH
jgi:hypothetical protein